MKYLSVCSGVEAATVAWHHIGWQPVAFSEIEPFPSAVLAHHYPHVPNLGDMTKYKEWNLNESIDLVVGGTPCQSFSVAGLRKGLQDPRGNLALTYCGILDKFKPRWCVWENVVGILSSNGGRDFSSFIGALGELGYHLAYRVLDAQYVGGARAVPQRRRRVILVGHTGGWLSPSKVLFESQGVFGNYPKSRGQRQTTARGSKSRAPNDDSTIGTLLARDYKGLRNQDLTDGRGLILEPKVYENHPNDSRIKEMGNICTTVTSRWGTGGGNVPIALVENTIGRQPQNGGNGNGFTEGGPMYTLNATGVHGVANDMAVRRLTPIECERLMGMPDNYTNIPWRNKPESPDGLRYKACGNSMAINVMRWVGERISMFD